MHPFKGKSSTEVSGITITDIDELNNDGGANKGQKLIIIQSMYRLIDLFLRIFETGRPLIAPGFVQRDIAFGIAY